VPPRHRRPALAEGEVRLAHERLPFLGPAVDRVYTEPLLSLRAGLGASGTFVRSVDGEQVDAERVVAARCADLERGMAHQGYDLQLTRYDARGWRATFYTTGMEHSPTSATSSAWERAPWLAGQGRRGRRRTKRS